MDKASFKDIVKTVFKAIIEGVETAILNMVKKVKETYTDIKAKIPTMEEIKEILPEWMTDPIAVLKRLIKQLSKYLSHVEVLSYREKRRVYSLATTLWTCYIQFGK